jgi:hypothetical protein
MIAAPVSDLPAPDSPTTPRISPGAMSNWASRGLVTASSAKLTSVKAKPSSATHRPAGTNVHQAPVRSAESLLAQ